MITCEEAIKAVISTRKSFGTETIDINQSLGRILAEPILADRAFPPFDRVCMDGIAIDYNSFLKGQISYGVEGVQAAGQPQLQLINPTNCIEVMTGAILPEGTTTVIRYEDLKKVAEGEYKIDIDVVEGANIHYLGTDKPSGQILIDSNTKIDSPELALLATVGKTTVTVKKLPKIALISTGDELVEIEDIPKPFQIRKSNIHMLASELDRLKIDFEMIHVDDDFEIIKSAISKVLIDFDVIMMSGGVSMGKFDFIPDALVELGVKKLFHKVAQRPGKPFWFGNSDGCTVFAFPGNPVSTLVGFKYYFQSWLHACLGQQKSLFHVRLGEDFNFTPKLTYFAQTILKDTPTGLEGIIDKGHGSGDMVTLAGADGFMNLPADQSEFRAGDYYEFISI